MRSGRTSQRERREQRRRVAAETEQRNKDAKERAAARQAIAERLAEVPTSWRRRYAALLTEHGLDPKASLPHVSSLPNLKARVRLLPPKVVYVHMRNANHPSLPEPRVVDASMREGYKRSTNKRACGNERAFSPSLLMFPRRPTSRASLLAISCLLSYRTGVASASTSTSCTSCTGPDSSSRSRTSATPMETTGRRCWSTPRSSDPCECRCGYSPRRRGTSGPSPRYGGTHRTRPRTVDKNRPSKATPDRKRFDI